MPRRINPGAGTYEASSVVFDYEELESATLKGESEPVTRVPRQVSPGARFGTGLTRPRDTPFIGREIDLALLKGIFDQGGWRPNTRRTTRSAVVSAMIGQRRDLGKV
jgi:hypothetical protein